MYIFNSDLLKNERLFTRLHAEINRIVDFSSLHIAPVPSAPRLSARHLASCLCCDPEHLNAPAHFGGQGDLDTGRHREHLGQGGTLGNMHRSELRNFRLAALPDLRLQNAKVVRGWKHQVWQVAAAAVEESVEENEG